MSTTSRTYLLHFLIALSAIVIYQKAAASGFNEEKYLNFLRKARRGEIIIRGAAGVTYDAAVGNTGNGTSSTGSLNHAANVMVLIGVSYRGTTSPNALTVGGTSATSLYKQSHGSTNTEELFYIYRTSAANETVSVGFASSTRYAWNAVSYTGAANLGASSFENTSHNSNQGASPANASVAVGAGTTGAMIIIASGCRDDGNKSASITIAPANGETQRDITRALGGSPSTPAVSAEMQEYSQLTAFTTSTTDTESGETLDWVIIATRLLPGVISQVTTGAVGVGIVSTRKNLHQAVAAIVGIQATLPLRTEITTVGGTTYSQLFTTSALYGAAIIPTISGTLLSIGVNIQTAAGNICVGIYSTYSGGKFSGLLGHSASIAAVTGWNDVTVTGVTFTAGTTYYICFENDNGSLAVYHIIDTEYETGSAYNTFGDPTNSISELAHLPNMRVIYNPRRIPANLTQAVASMIGVAVQSTRKNLHQAYKASVGIAVQSTRKNLHQAYKASVGIAVSALASVPALVFASIGIGITSTRRTSQKIKGAIHLAVSSTQRNLSQKIIGTLSIQVASARKNLTQLYQAAVSISIQSTRTNLTQFIAASVGLGLAATPKNLTQTIQAAVNLGVASSHTTSQRILASIGIQVSSERLISQIVAGTVGIAVSGVASFTALVFASIGIGISSTRRTSQKVSGTVNLALTSAHRNLHQLAAGTVRFHLASIRRNLTQHTSGSVGLNVASLHIVSQRVHASVGIAVSSLRATSQKVKATIGISVSGRIVKRFFVTLTLKARSIFPLIIRSRETMAPIPPDEAAFDAARQLAATGPSGKLRVILDIKDRSITMEAKERETVE